MVAQPQAVPYAGKRICWLCVQVGTYSANYRGQRRRRIKGGTTRHPLQWNWKHSVWSTCHLDGLSTTLSVYSCSGCSTRRRQNRRSVGRRTQINLLPNSWAHYLAIIIMVQPTVLLLHLGRMCKKESTCRQAPVLRTSRAKLILGKGVYNHKLSVGFQLIFGAKDKWRADPPLSCSSWSVLGRYKSSWVSSLC